MRRSRKPRILGFPVWTGLKRRVGKKHLRRGLRRRVFAEWKDVKIGELFSACTGLNHRLAAVEPEYKLVGTSGGKVLSDLDVIAEDGASFSFIHCGVGPPLSYEEAEQSRAESIREAPAEGDPHDVAIRFSPEVMTIHSDGTFSIDEEAFKRRRASKNV